MFLVGNQLQCVLFVPVMCVHAAVSSCFRFSAFDSAMSWAVGERALQRRFHVPFYVHLRSCAMRRRRCFLNSRPLNANLRRLAVVIQGGFRQVVNSLSPSRADCV